ncbi:unnamed protein product [Callosobruchus maculatus]|nr:unnamed protein product [Callosobruchus maculatus]
MPQLICNTCRNLTQQAYIFKTNCKKADEALKLFLATGQLSKPYLQKVEQLSLPAPQPIILNSLTPKEPPPPKKVGKIKQIKLEAGEVITVDVTEDEDVEEIEQGQHENEEIFGIVEHVEPEADNSMEETEYGEVLGRFHQIPKSETPQFSCTRCEKVFLSQENLNAHMTRHKKIKPFTCDVCNKSFVFKQGLEQHTLTHAQNSPHKCNYCNSSFQTAIALTRHITQHEGLRPYLCKVCNRTFVQSHHLTRHMRIHFAVKSAKPDNVVNTFKCDLCSMSFRRKDYLINHSAIHSMVNLRCAICSTEFETAALVKEHITTHLTGLPFPCQKCDYSFDTEEQLELHELKHAEMMYEDQIEREVITEAIEKGEMSFGNEMPEDMDIHTEQVNKRHVRGYSKRKRNESSSSGLQEVQRTYGKEQEEGREEPQVQEYTIIDLDNQIPEVEEGEEQEPVSTANDFLKDELDEEFEANGFAERAESYEAEPENTEPIKPIVRQEGTKVYSRKFKTERRPRPQIVKNYAQLQPQPIDTITIDDDNATANVITDATPVEERLPIVNLDQLKSEPVYEKKAMLRGMGGKVVKVQKFIITKEEMKAMAKQGILELKDGKVVLKNSTQPILNASLKTVEKREINSFLEKRKEFNQLKQYQKRMSDAGERPENDIWR